MTIRTNPPGARVYVDDYEIGTTPVSTNFTYYGTRKIRLVKPGYETLTVMEPIHPPWYQIPPLDFFSENLWPGELHDRRSLTYQMDMRYYRQGYEIPIEVDLDELANTGKEILVKQFNDLHKQFYGYQMEGTACEIVNLRAVGIGKVHELPYTEEEVDSGSSAEAAVVDEHEVYFEGGWIPTKIYDRAKLKAGNRLEGPAVITEFDSTTVVLNGFTAEIDRFKNILINPSDTREG